MLGLDSSLFINTENEVATNSILLDVHDRLSNANWSWKQDRIPR